MMDSPGNAKENGRRAIAARVASKQLKAPVGRSAGADSDLRRGEGGINKADFNRILALLRDHSTIDFSHYKASSIKRRIERRMALNSLATPGAYIKFLKGKREELDTLYSD